MRCATGIARPHTVPSWLQLFTHCLPRLVLTVRGWLDVPRHITVAGPHPIWLHLGYWFVSVIPGAWLPIWIVDYWFWLVVVGYWLVLPHTHSCYGYDYTLRVLVVRCWYYPVTPVVYVVGYDPLLPLIYVVMPLTFPIAVGLLPGLVDLRCRYGCYVD